MPHSAELFHRSCKFPYLFGGLPHDLGELCRAVDGIYIHFMSETTTHYPVLADRKPEINLLDLASTFHSTIQLLPTWLPSPAGVPAEAADLSAFRRSCTAGLLYATIAVQHETPSRSVFTRNFRLGSMF